MRKISGLVIVLFFSAFYCFAQPKDASNLKKVSLTFSEKDFTINLTDEKVTKGNHSSEIVRKSANETENLLIRKAEALYPDKSDIANSDKSRDSTEFTEKVFSPTIEEKPYWSIGSFDGVKIAGVITTRAISYYQELSLAFRNNKKPTSIPMSETSFSYSATIKHHDKFEMIGEKFENVNVVSLELSWSQYCGNLCAMGFNREKIIVFDNNNEPVAMFADIGGTAWVS